MSGGQWVAFVCAVAVVTAVAYTPGRGLRSMLRVLTVVAVLLGLVVAALL